MNKAINADAYTGYHVGGRNRAFRLPDVKAPTYGDIAGGQAGDNINRQYQRDRADRQIARDWHRLLRFLAHTLVAFVYMSTGFLAAVILLRF